MPTSGGEPPGGGGTSEDAPATSERGGVEVDALTALGTALARPDGRIASLADRAGEGPLLVVVAERTSAACHTALSALTAAGGRLAVVSQGRPEAAAALVAATAIPEARVLIDPAPHPVSAALAADGVPTFALVEDLDVVAWQDGWEPELIAPLLHRAGGRLPTEAGPPRAPDPSRTTADPAEQARLEAQDAAPASER